MSQLKNGTLLVVAATVITSVLILMTDRDQAKPESTTKVVENETSIIKDESEIAEAVKLEENVEVNVQDEAINVVQSDSILPPKGPFNEVIPESESVTVIEPSKVISETSQHEVLNHIVQPIWMDQKLGDFKSVEKGEVVFKMLPTNPDGLQGENPQQVVTSKDDKFIPTTISANYDYQQMPMYNGGYYIAPMPSYLMPSMLPGNLGIDKK